MVTASLVWFLKQDPGGCAGHRASWRSTLPSGDCIRKPLHHSCGGLGEREGTAWDRDGDAFQRLGGERLGGDGIGDQPVHHGVGFDRDRKRGNGQMLKVGRQCAGQQRHRARVVERGPSQYRQRFLGAGLIQPGKQRRDQAWLCLRTRRRSAARPAGPGAMTRAIRWPRRRPRPVRGRGHAASGPPGQRCSADPAKSGRRRSSPAAADSLSAPIRHAAAIARRCTSGSRSRPRAAAACAQYLSLAAAAGSPARRRCCEDARQQHARRDRGRRTRRPRAQPRPTHQDRKGSAWRPGGQRPAWPRTRSPPHRTPRAEPVAVGEPGPTGSAARLRAFHRAGSQRCRPGRATTHRLLRASSTTRRSGPLRPPAASVRS